MSDPGTTITPFLMFTGQAEEAMDFYCSVFPGGKVEEIARYGEGEAGAEGSVKTAVFTIHGQKLMCTDSAVETDFTFTPSLSLFVTCGSEEEIDGLFESLSAGGKALMPLDDYGFSRKFAWVEDKFGVTWQLNLP